LAAGCRVFVLVWKEPDEAWGLADSVARMIGLCRKAIAARTGSRRLFLAGHSLGGTFAAIQACLHPADVDGLITLGAPLDFATGFDVLSPLARTLPLERVPPGNLPGSLLTAVAIATAPVAFSVGPSLDRLFGGIDRRGRETILRVERWSLDELPIARTLLVDVVEQLYRDNGLVRGRLRIRGQRVHVEEFAAPVLSVVDARCALVPPQAVEPFHRAIRSKEASRLLRYHGDSGVLLQHVGMLVGRSAHQRLWPEIFAWVGRLAPRLQRAAG
jgi:polyhydroxyalkanoate synthase subunit PhaC